MSKWTHEPQFLTQLGRYSQDSSDFFEGNHWRFTAPTKHAERIVSALSAAEPQPEPELDRLTKIITKSGMSAGEFEQALREDPGQEVDSEPLDTDVGGKTDSVESAASSDLARCPFCGKLAELQHHGGIFKIGQRDGYQIECLYCAAKTCYWHTLEQAKAAWNKRAGVVTEGSPSGQDQPINHLTTKENLVVTQPENTATVESSESAANDRRCCGKRGGY